jgi:hypothetical protein
MSSPFRALAARGAALALLFLPPSLFAQANPDEFAPSRALKRRAQTTEAELLQQLRRDAVEIDLHAKSGYANKLVEDVKPPQPAEGEAIKSRLRSSPVHTLAILKQRNDLRGLPMREEPECKKSAVTARQIEKVSQSARDIATRYRGETSVGLAVRHANENGLVPQLIEIADKSGRTQLTTLLQMFEPQGPAVRTKLVELLAEWDNPQASVLLAQRAIYDLSPEVRATAIAALRNRPAKEYLPTVLAGLRYPWVPVADHAAEALVELRARDATADLVSLLDRPDPRRPFLDDKKQTVVSELVAVNHLRNCLLCHAPSFDDSDPIRGAVPVPGEALTPLYYNSPDFSRSTFVRADITYLKQDFSVFQPVADAKPWPDEQRFDYLIRHREVSAGESSNKKETATYPQREAVLFALRELTDEDRGPSSAEWRTSLEIKKAGRKP